MAIDPSTLEYQYNARAGGSGAPVTSVYSVNFSSGGQDYTFIPDSVINKGVKSGDNTYVMPWFLNKENLGQLGKVGQKIDLNGQSWYGDWLKNNIGASTTGFLVPAGSVPFDSEVKTFPTSQGEVQGIAEKNGQLVYTQSAGSNQTRYMDNSGTTHTTTYTPGRSLLGEVFGGIGDAAADFINSDIGKLTMVAAAAYAGGAFDPSSAAATGGEVAGTEAANQATQQAVADGLIAGGTPSSIDSLASSYYGLPAGAEYVAPTVTDLGTVAGTTEGIASGTTAADIAGMGGAQGLTAPTAANLAEMGGAQGLGGATTLGNLAEMGGAQGLTTAAAGGAAGDLLSASGAGGIATPATAGIGAGLGTTAAGINTGAAGLGNAASGAVPVAGSTLADILPYTTGAGVVGSLLQSQAAKDAANAQSAAAQAAIAQQQKNFDIINAQQAPYRAAGYGALNQLANLGSGQTQQYDAAGNVIGTVASPSDYLTHQFNAADLKSGLAPNYDFMLQQGQMANQRAANAGGGALGGNALQGLNKYTQDYAGNAYQNAFTNYQNQRSNIYNTLAGIAGIGQTGQNATNTAATNATNAATQLGVGSAGAQAAGTVGSANAYTNAINNATNKYTLASLLNQRGNVTMPG